MKVIYLAQAEGLSVALLGPARSSVDVLILNYAFSFEPPSNCACIFLLQVKTSMRGHGKNNRFPA